ncbi:MAG: ferrochelatase [Planctomycetales bacterium]|nr:ferrochelatase [Planctomycetales bacterium]
MPESYDALLFVSFGGPEGMDDVIPFLRNVLRGRNVPEERMLEVAEHYRQFGGVSPINEQNRQLIAAIEAELASRGIELPVYWGNRNWHPLLPDTLEQMKRDGVRRALAFMTSAFSSYSGCRQYRENILAAQQEVGSDAPVVDKLRVFFNHPGFVEAQAARLNEAAAELPAGAAPHVIFTAHSIPLAMATSSSYETQLQSACRLVASAAGCDSWELAYQSRSGPPTQPWLEPDICDALQALFDRDPGRPTIVCPIGFLSDHMEVLFDLDTEAKQAAERLGHPFARAGTVGCHPKFVAMIVDLIQERREGGERLALGELPPSHDVCPEDCCPSGRPARPSHSG